jgi:hypothetical protein
MAFNWFKKKTPASQGPDFSEIDSQEKAAALHKKGELVALYLFPPMFGGDEGPLNQVFVPEFVVMLKDRFDNVVADLLEQGKVTGYSASPEYKGKSFIPSALILEAKGTGSITERIEIW